VVFPPPANVPFLHSRQVDPSRGLVTPLGPEGPTSRPRLAAALLVLAGCASSVTIPPALAKRATIVPVRIDGVPFAEKEVHLGASTAHDIRTSSPLKPNPRQGYIPEDRYAFSYVFGTGERDLLSVECEAGFGSVDATAGSPTGPDMEMPAADAVKIQLACNARPLAPDARGIHLALKTRESPFNLAPTVALSGDLDVAITIQSFGISPTRGWTVSQGIEFSTLSGASVGLLDLHGVPSLRLSQRVAAETRQAIESLVPAFVLYSSYERLRMRSE
jgi:hypothetical protein